MSTQVHAQVKAPAVQALRINSSAPTGILQRKCACGGTPGPDGECGACRQKRLAMQRRARNTEQAAPATAPPIVHEVLHSPGQPLDTATRIFMEPRLGHDFSRVRVHADGQAAESARAVNALAYTVGRDIVFGTGQYTPGTMKGEKLLAHELTHVVQQDSLVAPHPQARLAVGNAHDEYEHEADQAATALVVPEQDESARTHIQPAKRVQDERMQRFSQGEHQRIGTEAYEEAYSEAEKPPPGQQVSPAIDKSLLANLGQFHNKLSRPDEKVSQYGQLVAAADHFASFSQVEEQAKKGHLVLENGFLYYDLAARNRAHFHPHNFINWQRWHWQALHIMYSAWQLTQEADTQKAEADKLLQRFNEHERRAREAFLQLDAMDQGEAGRDRRDELEKIATQESEQMRQILVQVAEPLQQSRAKRERARGMALQAMAMNGFGDHFLTDAFAGGHIVTPRKELLDEYSTKFLGFLPVQPELSCASVPSLAWHDLDNRFGVNVVSKKDPKGWLTFGDDYADSDPSHEPKSRSLSPTLEHVIAATKASIKQMLGAAAGKMPGDLSPVLDYIPQPNLDKYPLWEPTPRVAWEAQLRYATGAFGEMIPTASFSSSEKSQSPQSTSGGSQSEKNQPPQSTPGGGQTVAVPNPKGQQFGLRSFASVPVLAGILSAGFTCLNVLPLFSYEHFVLPMIKRLKTEYAQQFFTGSQGQIVSPDEKPQPQESASGHGLLGSFIGLGIGGLAGVGVGLLVGGPLGAILGTLIGLTGLVVGGLIGSSSRGAKKEEK